MKEEVLIKMGKKLKELRIQKGYTSHETFAHDNNFSRSYYWRIENGKANLTMDKLLDLLSIHNISLNEFFANF